MPVVGRGVDVSYAQGFTANEYRRFQKALSDAGATFSFAKASQDWFEDSNFNGDFIAFFPAFKRMGLIAGAYHFLMEPGAGASAGYNAGRGCLEPDAQARVFIAAIKRANHGSLDGVLCAVDWENFNYSLGYKVNSAPRFSHVIGFEKEFHRIAPKQPLFIYAGGKLGTNDLREMIAGPVFLWLARWTVSTTNDITGDPHIPEDWWSRRTAGKFPSIIQYQSGSEGGRVGNAWVDLNATNLSKEELRRLSYPIASGTPGPTPDPPPPGPGDPPVPDPLPTPSPWPEPWLDPETGNVDPERVAVTTAGAGGLIGFGGALLLIGGIGAVWMLSRNKPNIFGDE